MNQSEFDIAVIGGGIVGLACAYQICRAYPEMSIAVLEKEDRLAPHQTGHNSGVIHSGLYYIPGSVKAETCTQGRRELINFAQQYDIKHSICGKIVVAVNQAQQADLERIHQNGIANGLKGLELLDPADIKQIEPFCTGVQALRVSETGIIDFVAVAEKLAGLIAEAGQNKIMLNNRVTGFEPDSSRTKVLTDEGFIWARYIINCAGLHSDRIAKLAGVVTDKRIVPFRGDYLELTGEAARKVNTLIYPVPDPKFPFLGVHFTRTIDNSVECGPSAVFSFKREGYSKTAFNLKDTIDSLTFSGTWRLFIRHWKFGLGEYSRAFCGKLMLKQLRKLIPSLTSADVRSGKSGIRAQALDGKGQLIDDFCIETADNMIHVLNAPSPAATASLAIGRYITKIAGDYFNIKP
jgi:L-2-hydroxyglutarate oxidase